MSKKKYIAAIKDRDNRIWVYEGTVNNHPIWIWEQEAKPLELTEEEAVEVAEAIVQPEETILIREVK